MDLSISWQLKVLLTLTTTLAVLGTPLVQAHDITVPSTAYFGLPTYGTYINFASGETLDSAYRESAYWYFDGYGFRIQNGNLSIDNFFTGDRVEAVVYGFIDQTSTTNITGKENPESVTGATTWSWLSDILTFTVVNRTEQRVEISWTEQGGSSEGNGNGGTGGVSPVVDLPEPVKFQAEKLGLYILAVGLGVVVLGGILAKPKLAKVRRNRVKGKTTVRRTKARGYKGRKKKK